MTNQATELAISELQIMAQSKQNVMKYAPLMLGTGKKLALSAATEPCAMFTIITV